MKLDVHERHILTTLQREGRMTNAALAKSIGLSESGCLRRLRGLERAGVIDGYAAVVNRRAIGLALTAFVLVTVEKQPAEGTADFHARVRAEPHIVECHAMSGAHDYLLKVVARDMDHFSTLVMEGILKYPDVRHVESAFSLREIKAPQGAPI